MLTKSVVLTIRMDICSEDEESFQQGLQDMEWDFISQTDGFSIEDLELQDWYVQEYVTKE
jgi:hypothetical protein